jgi:hypothetical protein
MLIVTKPEIGNTCWPTLLFFQSVAFGRFDWLLYDFAFYFFISAFPLPQAGGLLLFHSSKRRQKTRQNNPSAAQSHSLARYFDWPTRLSGQDSAKILSNRRRRFMRGCATCLWVRIK